MSAKPARTLENVRARVKPVAHRKSAKHERVAEGVRHALCRAASSARSYPPGMARMRRANSKTALGAQRAALRQASRHQQFVGQDAASAAGRSGERARVRRMQ